MPQGPSILNPIVIRKRRCNGDELYCCACSDEGYINRAEYDAAFNAPVTARYHTAEIEVSAPYLAEMVRLSMIERFGVDEAYNGGYRGFHHSKFGATACRTAGLGAKTCMPMTSVMVTVVPSVALGHGLTTPFKRLKPLARSIQRMKKLSKLFVVIAGKPGHKQKLSPT